MIMINTRRQTEKVDKLITGSRKNRVSRKFRIVMLIGQLGMGGSERQLYLLLKHINKELFECHVIVFNPSPHLAYDEALEKHGIMVWPVPLNCKGIPRRIRHIYGKLENLAPDIVHSWTVHDNPYGGLVGWLAGVPVRLGSLRGSLSSPGMHRLHPLFRVLSIRSVSGIVVNAEEHFEELKTKGYPSNRIFLIPNCVDIPSYDDLISSNGPDLSSLEIEGHHRIVGIVGNLRSVKNHMMFVEGMGLILPHFPDVRGLIVGQPAPDEPELSHKIESEIKRLGLEDKIILAGFREDVPKLMQRLTIFCLTSSSEGTPNVILEAMAAARPVVATRVGGIPGLIENGVNGMLVEPDDVGAFAWSVETLLNNRELAERLGKAGRAIVEHRFGCEQMALQFENLYREALISRGYLPR